jgi:hypothetical protein
MISRAGEQNCSPLTFGGFDFQTGCRIPPLLALGRDRLQLRWRFWGFDAMNYRAASRAVSEITTPKNYAASPAFYFCFR